MNDPSIKALILDMDGVIWRNQQPIGDLPAIFGALNQKKIKFCFATNNSSKTVDSYQKRLEELGVLVTRDQIFTSAKSTAEMLASQYPHGGNIFVVGMPGLIETLEEYGFPNSEADPVAVVAGIDYTVSYEKLQVATLLIRSGVPFIGTNPDKTFPTPEGQVPGAGAIIAAISAATDTEAVIVGKPQPTIFHNAMQFLGEDPQDVLVVGDRLETDIAGGQAAGCKTAVTLTGVSTLEQASKWTPTPEFIVEDLASLVERL
jgi:4-nitrophenyl phosphatase